MKLDIRNSLNLRTIGLLGVLTPIIAYCGIILAILINLEWFSWTDNALSDLGNYKNLELKAIVFNSGLVVTGLCALIFCNGFYFQEKEAYSGDKTAQFFVKAGTGTLFFAILALIGIGIFSEDFGDIHRIVSEVFFALIPFSMVFLGIAFYRREELKIMGILVIITGIIAAMTWISYFILDLFPNVAIPETISSIAVSLSIIVQGIRYYKLNQ
jgi:hypothetical membrane protein